MTCSPKTDTVVNLVLRYMLVLRKGKSHATKRYKPEQIIIKLIEAEVEFSKGNVIGRTFRSWVLQKRHTIVGVGNKKE